MPNKVYYKGIYKEAHIQFEEGLVHVAAFPYVKGKFIEYAKPHAHPDFLQLFVIEESSTELLYKNEKYEIEGPAFFIIPKNNTHGFISKPDVKGWIINLADAALERILQRETDILAEIDVVHIIRINEGDEQLQALYQLLLDCVAEYHNKEAGKYLVLQSLIRLIIVHFYRSVHKATKLSEAERNNASKIYFRRFMHSIRHHQSFKRRIEEYADELHITKGQLIRACKYTVGKSPKDVVTNYFIREAKVSLSNVEKSIAEIAYDLGFEDPSYFARLFKKKTGVTPKGFRTEYDIQ